MPSLSPRILFYFVIVLYILLAPHPRRLHTSSDLLECRPLAHPPPDQCAHVTTHCPPPDTILAIPYLQSYFCSAPATRPLTFAFLLFWLLFLFSTLGISASDFFTPNLATIAQLLGLDENVAGVTFLAFGNGSGDVFSTFSAMRAGSGSLAIGELVGAATFLTCCVVGAMCVIKPFAVERGPFLRDVGFFTAALALLIVVLWDATIRAWEAGALVGLYVVYAITVVGGSWWERRRTHRALALAVHRDDHEATEPYQDDDSDIPHVRSQHGPPVPAEASATTAATQSSQHTTQLPSFSFVSALGFRASLKHKSSRSSLVPSEHTFTARPDPIPCPQPSPPPPPPLRRVPSVLIRTANTLFPTLRHFKTQGFFTNAAAAFSAPAVLLLTLTLPVVVTPHVSDPLAQKVLSSDDPSPIRPPLIEIEGNVDTVLAAEEDMLEEIHSIELTFNKWLVAVQCICGPVFCVAVLADGMEYQPTLFAALSAGGLVAAILVMIYMDSETGNHPTAKMLRCSMGFFVAIVWIMVIADEVVSLLQTFGLIFGLSDAIIGLTVFAIANSLGDLVANTSVAAFAPIMGFSACFGSPMLNILFGVGFSGSFIIHKNMGKPYDLEFSHTLFVSTAGLLILLTMTLVLVPLNNYLLTRRWGVLLLASYVTLMIVNICVELQNGEGSWLFASGL